VALILLLGNINAGLKSKNITLKNEAFGLAEKMRLMAQQKLSDKDYD
jgi:hypothetical protein